MIKLKRGRYTVRTAETSADIRAAQALRARCFGLGVAADQDAFDDICTHLLIHRNADGALVCCFRMLPLTGAEISRSYSAQYYELSALEAYDGKMVEMGRFCVH
ncbi:MAG: GNAT family N-acetyltransferase, partial [Pseudomonadota bacterium]